MPERPPEPAKNAAPASLSDATSLIPAPPEFRVRMDTTRGAFTLTCHRHWAPRGADRFHTLVSIGFFDDIAVFRVVKGFVAQFGIHGDPAVSAAWRNATIAADPVVVSNVPGTLSFAQTGNPDSRTTQFFLNFGDNSRLDGLGFAPVCEVTEGMSTVLTFNSKYGEELSRQQARIQVEGNAFLRKEFPDLDYIVAAAVLPPK